MWETVMLALNEDSTALMIVAIPVVFIVVGVMASVITGLIARTENAEGETYGVAKRDS